jgi:glycosyltransferase involved in cell wall biosynthesis
MAHAVVFAGHADDVRKELRDADVFVLPSYSEGNSNAILEAMREGLPIVATNVGGAAFQVGQVGAPFLFAPGERHLLTEHLLRLVEEADLRTSTGLAMRERVEETFSMEQVARLYVGAYSLVARRLGSRLSEMSRSPGCDWYDHLNG